ncbi:MAG: glycosyltransferase family 4 protein, partial [Fibrobacteria bacterium]
VAVRLVRDGYTCIQYSHAYPGCKPEETVGGVLVRRRGGKFLFNFTVYLRVRAWCRRDRIDVVLDDSNKVPFLLPWLAPVPVVAQIHHLFGRVLFHEAALPMALYVLAFESIMPAVYRRTRVLTGSASSRSELLAKGFGNVAIAPEGVDLSVYHPPADPAKSGNRILYVGRIKRYKGLDVILNAATRLKNRHPDLELQIAGSGDDVPRLKALAKSLGMDGWTHFLGFVPEADKVGLYGAARVVVNSSLKEGWGLTSIEANACGTPVVATDVPGLCDSVRHGETGFLVPFGDVDGFASALGRILADPAAAETMREKALAWARAHTWDKAYEVTRDALLAASLEAEASCDAAASREADADFPARTAVGSRP